MKLKTMLIAVALGGLMASAAVGGEPAPVRPAKSASGRKGAFELRLDLLKTNIKVGESPFVRTKIVNRSKKPMELYDWVYRGSKDLGEEWSGNCEVKIGNFIEVQNSKGRSIEPATYYGQGPIDSSPFDQIVSTSVDPAISRLIDDLQVKGMSDAAINERLRVEAVSRERRAREEKYPPVQLKENQVAQSVQWCSGRDMDLSAAPACPGSGFVELPFFKFQTSGHYRIRAVYDYRRAKGPRVATDWIAVEVSK